MSSCVICYSLVLLIFSINKSRKPSATVSMAKSVSRRYNFISSQRMRDLQHEKLKKKSEAKMNWGIMAYDRWRSARLKVVTGDDAIDIVDIHDFENLTKSRFIEAMCYFIPEVVKKNDELYPGPTLYQMCVAIQKFLNFNKIMWKIVEGPEFYEIKTVLDNVMKERTLMGVGNGKKIAKLITFEMENDLWDRGFLGSDTPDKLRTTVFYQLGLKCCLRGVGEHYYLRRDIPEKSSQLSFQRDSKGVRCLVYTEDSVTKTHDGGLRDMRRDRKVVWVHPNVSQPERCTVMLVDKYVSLCPSDFHKKANFYLQSKQKPNPACWYSREVIGQNSIGKIIGSLMESAGYQGFFSGHSLRRSGGTRLFQAGVQRKLVKEMTGHTSDAIDKYQVTSDSQKHAMSKILQGNPVATTTSNSEISKVGGTAVDACNVPNVKEAMPSVNENVSCVVSQKDKQFSGLIEQIIQSVNANSKAKIKIEIEFTKE